MFADPIDQREANEQIKFESRGDAQPFHILNNYSSRHIHVAALQNRYLSVTEHCRYNPLKTVVEFQNNLRSWESRRNRVVVPACQAK
jgi:hypothetical protein